ncbi:protein kinase domain-containing protein [Microbulbifer aggregans]|uniref:protein kinase domain-containing protein n=1 Tax=Microbulbifer aggregans TaxID=1769779 RepID=UPI001CFECBB2|nr:protein kinase [Microbulbifer aggregans]
MTQDRDFGFLGLAESASPRQVQEAAARKQAQLQQALAKAPTDALKQKYQQQLDKLAQLATTLQSEATADASRNPSLSHTKLADLPQSATQFDGGEGPQVTLEPGTVLAGRFTIEERIGAGGMGAVFRAHDKNRGEDIALKVLLPQLTKNPRARERFLDEARLASQLSHPNIVNVFDVQQDGELFFITMELLEGQDLRSYLDNLKLGRQQIPVSEAMRIASAVCDGLAHAHERTVHRDIKPENIWLTEDGKVKVMDFGIARVQSTSQRTQTGAAMGTAYYMAPEQLQGRSDIDGRADQYALGVLLYEMLTEKIPAGRIDPAYKVRSEIGKKLSATIDRLLSNDPNARFADMEQVKLALAGKGKGGGFALPDWPWKQVGISAGVLVALLSVGGLVASGSIDLGSLKKLLPMSQEEIAARKAELAKIEGEIGVLHRRLESGRRELENTLRTAEREDDKNLPILRVWKRAVDSEIFSGSAMGELEGNLKMAQTLLRENAFDQARPVFEQVRAGYNGLVDALDARGKHYRDAQAFDSPQRTYEQALLYLRYHFTARGYQRDLNVRFEANFAAAGIKGVNGNRDSALPPEVVEQIKAYHANGPDRPKAIERVEQLLGVDGISAGDGRSVMRSFSQVLSYSDGRDSANWMIENGYSAEPDSAELAINDVNLGIESRLSDSERDAVEKRFKAESKVRSEEREKLAGIKNLAEGQAFLAENAGKPGVVTTKSGLQYLVLREGTGKSPKSKSVVKVDYRGTFLDGQEFDSSYKRGESTEFSVNTVISGWTEALQLMKEGAKWKIFVPSNLAYGDRSVGKIGPNSTLIFEVELQRIVAN